MNETRYQDTHVVRNKWRWQPLNVMTAQKQRRKNSAQHRGKQYKKKKIMMKKEKKKEISMRNDNIQAAGGEHKCPSIYIYIIYIFSAFYFVVTVKHPKCLVRRKAIMPNRHRQTVAQIYNTITCIYTVPCTLYCTLCMDLVTAIPHCNLFGF